MKPIRYYIGMIFYNINERKEEKYWENTEKFFNYLGPELIVFFCDISSKYAHRKTKKSKILFQWYYWIKFYSMYIPEKLYRLFCDLLRLDY